MRDYPAEYDHENLDNSLLAQAFPDAKGLGDLYRQTYKYTECGPWLSAQIKYIKVLEPDGFDDYPYEQEVVEWIHSDDLYNLGTWAEMDANGVLVTALMVGSIVEGCDNDGTGKHELEVKHLDEEPQEFAERFYEAVDEVNAEAEVIWNDTHGCETCAKHWHEEGWEDVDAGKFEGNDGITPVWEACPDCGGDGVWV